MQKQRYMVTLDQEKAFKTKRLLKDLGMPVNHFSVLLNEYLDMINPTLEQLVEKKRTGKQITLFEIIDQASRAAEKISK